MCSHGVLPHACYSSDIIACWPLTHQQYSMFNIVNQCSHTLPEVPDHEDAATTCLMYVAGSYPTAKPKVQVFKTHKILDKQHMLPFLDPLKVIVGHTDKGRPPASSSDCATTKYRA